MAPSIEVLWQRLAAVIQSIQEPNLQALLTSIFDEPTRRRFILAPEWASIIAYVGGLLEHTLEVVAYANTMLTEQGSNLNRDLLLTGCILHDIGKVEEYNLQSLPTDGRGAPTGSPRDWGANGGTSSLYYSRHL